VENVDFVRSISEDFNNGTRVIPGSLDNVDAFFNDYFGVTDIIWRSDGRKKRDVDPKWFRSHLPTAPDPTELSWISSRGHKLFSQMFGGWLSQTSLRVIRIGNIEGCIPGYRVLRRWRLQPPFPRNQPTSFLLGQWVLQSQETSLTAWKSASSFCESCKL
jgi:hypothetical protein